MGSSFSGHEYVIRTPTEQCPAQPGEPTNRPWQWLITTVSPVGRLLWLPVNKIHPTAVIGPEVTLGSGNTVGPFAVLQGPLVLGDGNWVGPSVVLGTPPEVRGFDHGDWESPGQGHGVDIGSGNVIREFATIHAGWQARTKVGDDCFIMNKVYVGHDGHIGSGVTMAAGVNLGGHVVVGEDANLGLGAQVHQRRIIGPGAMVGMGSIVTRDVLPFGKVYGNPARIAAANVFRLRKAGWPEAAISELDGRYRQMATGEVEPGDLSDLPVEFAAAHRWWMSTLTN